MMDSTDRPLQFDIYWVDLNPTKGSEIKKTRPCIIVSPNEMNKVLKTAIVVPLTSTVINWPFRLSIASTGKKSSAACDQIRTVSLERLDKRIGKLNQKEELSILELLQDMFSAHHKKS